MPRRNHVKGNVSVNTHLRDARIARKPFTVSDGIELRKLNGPAIVMQDPKHVVNIATMIRNCAAFGVNILCYTGDRIDLPSGRKDERGTVQVIHNDFPLHLFSNDVSPVAIEIMPEAIPLPYFKHPENAVYVFGPEDGSISTGLRAMCHHFVVIPSLHCLNLAQAAGIVLYDRVSKL
jgi:tRNA(Leu) C34 or U34 (ribose-2'-O)-methylase TrmL